MSDVHTVIPTPPPLVLLSSVDDYYDEHANLLLALFPAAPEIDPPRPHEHQWFIGCRKDMHGTTVLDCACGARKRTKGSSDGEEIAIDPPTSVMGDVLFDYSTIDDQGRPQATA